MPSRHLSARLTIAAAALAACGAHAEQAPAGAEAHAQPPQPATQAATKPAAAPAPQRVEINGARYDPRRDDTASKTVVGSEEILRYGDTSVLDVLKRVPGVTVIGGGVRMRGLGAGYTQVLLNGERAPAGFSIDALAPELIERIEVMRAASAEFSTQAIAGTINIVLRKTIKDAQREAKIAYAGGGTQRSGTGNLQLSDRAGAMSYSLTGALHRNFFDQRGDTVESGAAADGTPTLLRRISGQGVGRNDNLNLAPRLNWTLANGDTLSSQSFVNANRNSGRGRGARTTEYGRAPAFERDEQLGSRRGNFVRSDLGWTHTLADGAKLDLKIGANAGHNSNDTRSTGSNGGVLARDSSVLAVSTERGFSATGKYATPLRERHALSAGWDAGASRRDDSRRQRERDLPGSAPVNSDEDFSATVGRLALYGQDEWNVTPRWSVYAGLRWEGQATRSASALYDTVRQRNGVWSPLLHTLWKLPNSKDQLRLALTRTYKAPTTASLIPRRFTSLNNSQTEPDRRGNPRLQPELALGLDGSYEHYWADGALLSASASLRRIDGYTRQGLLLEGGRWLSTPVNDGRAVTRGIELEAKLPLRAVLAGAPAIDLRASVSRNWSRVDAVPGPDNRLDQQTPLSAVAGIDYKTAGGAFSAGASFAFRNGGAVRISEQQRAYAAVRRDVDLYLLWKITPQHRLRLALANLLGQDDFSASSYTDADGSLARSGTAASPMVARATLEIKF
ncbi:outer membrane receptor for ferrienterochelin and colicins [Janthinobacterium sp. CG_23.3]